MLRKYLISGIGLFSRNPTDIRLIWWLSMGNRLLIEFGLLSIAKLSKGLKLVRLKNGRKKIYWR